MEKGFLDSSEMKNGWEKSTWNEYNLKQKTQTKKKKKEQIASYLRLLQSPSFNSGRAKYAELAFNTCRHIILDMKEMKTAREW